MLQSQSDQEVIDAIRRIEYEASKSQDALVAAISDLRTRLFHADNAIYDMLELTIGDHYKRRGDIVSRAHKFLQDIEVQYVAPPNVNGSASGEALEDLSRNG